MSHTVSETRENGKTLGNWLLGSLCEEPVLSTFQLRRLEEHKYSCHSSSFIDPHMQPFWTWLVNRLPLWMAPNLITLTGLAINIVTSLILVYYSPDGKQDVPRWACLSCAVGLFFYQTLDAIDGKQARRTGTSSPLGELFDHGCDSLSIVFVSLAACITANLGTDPWWIFFQCFSAFTLFYCAHWQAYVSGTMKFGKFDVTEAQFGIIIIHLATALFGSHIWNIETYIFGLKLNILVEVVISGITIYNFLQEYLFLILQGGAGKNGSTVADTSVLSPSIPLIVVLGLGYLVAHTSEQHIFEQHPALYAITFGLVAAKITNKLVVAHMCRSELDCLDPVLLGPFLLLVNNHVKIFSSEYFALWLCLVWSAALLLRYCSAICLEICHYMGMHLFLIRPRKTAQLKTTHYGASVRKEANDTH